VNKNKQKLKRNTKRKPLTAEQTRELSDFIAVSKDSSGMKRAQAVLMLADNHPMSLIGQITGFGRSQAFNRRKIYEDKGLPGIQAKPRKAKRLLSKRQRRELAETLKAKTPADLGFEQDYWTTGLLGCYIDKQYKVQCKSKTSYYLIFKDSKFTFHKPGRIYQRHDEQAVREWKTANKDRVKQALGQTDTAVLTAGEMHLSNQTTVQKIWLPSGSYPKIEVAGKRQSRSIYGFLNIKTGQETAFKTNWQNMYVAAEVLGKLRAVYPTGKILLVWDKAPWHKGCKAQDFIKQDGNIEVIEFPGAAPEENPQEHVWKAGRSQTTHNQFITDIDQAKDSFINYLNATTFDYDFLGLKSEARKTGVRV